MVCDALGRPLRFILTAGQRHDSIPAKDLLDGFKADAVLADKAYDSNDLRQFIADAGAKGQNALARSKSPTTSTPTRTAISSSAASTSSNTSDASPPDTIAKLPTT